MPIIIHCPHDKTELKLKDENKGPEGLLECPKCGCTFRVCLAIFNKDCYGRMYPKITGNETVAAHRKRTRGTGEGEMMGNE